MESPIKAWRLEAGLSQSALADSAHISLMTVIRNEQALYSNPSPKIINVLKDAAVGPYLLSWNEWERLYHNYQMEVRAATDWAVINLVNFNPNSDSNSPNSNGDDHPFKVWREALGFDTRLAFCRAACVSSPQVLNYESARQRTMPKSIRSALSPFVAISPLVRLGKSYYDRRLYIQHSRI